MTQADRTLPGSLISLSLLLLARFPEHYQHLRHEVLLTFSESRGDVLDYTQLQQFRPIRNILNETLRLYSVLPLNSRIAARDAVVPSGGGPDGSQPMAVQKGQQIQLNMYAMHRRKDLWGADALSFNPSRWEDPARSALLADGWAFIPFVGPNLAFTRSTLADLGHSREARVHVSDVGQDSDNPEPTY
jgi:cytochrome P450